MLLACSKENKVNRKLDGDWISEVFFGSLPHSNENFRFHLDKNKQGRGTGYLSIEEGNSQDTYGISYFLNGEDRLAMEINSEAYIFQIRSYSRKRIELLDQYDQVTILIKD